MPDLKTNLSKKAELTRWTFLTTCICPRRILFWYSGILQRIKVNLIVKN